MPWTSRWWLAVMLRPALAAPTTDTTRRGHSAGQPIVAGWAYSWVAQLGAERSSWTAPVHAVRLAPGERPEVVAICQVTAVAHHLADDRANDRACEPDEGRTDRGLQRDPENGHATLSSASPRCPRSTRSRTRRPGRPRDSAGACATWTCSSRPGGARMALVAALLVLLTSCCTWRCGAGNRSRKRPKIVDRHED
jgi:hypothetical protein